LTSALPERLRLETRDLHAAAERSGVMGALLQGRLPLVSYRALLVNLHTIYAALERALEAHRHDPQAGPLRMPPLYRSAALASDLNSLRPPAQTREAPVEEAAASYAQRLAGGAPATLVAHAYVRYLGDLHGGQVLKRLVARAYGLADHGLRFYDFGSDEQVAALRQAFRAALAAVPVTPAQADACVAEARWAFVQHQRLFEQLLLRHPA
jgi:heme oxygenase